MARLAAVHPRFKVRTANSSGTKVPQPFHKGNPASEPPTWQPGGRGVYVRPTAGIQELP